MEQYQGANPNTRIVPNPRYEKFSKLRGWLLVFVVSFIFGIVGGAANLAMMIMELSPDFFDAIPLLFSMGHGFLVIATIIIIIGIVIALGLMIGIVTMIFQKSRYFSTLLIIAVILEIPMIVLLVMLYYMYPEYDNPASLISGFIRDILILVYFVKSVRVRTYMGTDEYLTKGPFSRLLMRLFKLPVTVEPYNIEYIGNTGIQLVDTHVPVALSAPSTTAVPATITTSASPLTPETPIPPTSPIPPIPPPPGWYPVPGSPGHICWWDGQAWIPESKRPQDMP